LKKNDLTHNNLIPLEEKSKAIGNLGKLISKMQYESLVKSLSARSLKPIL